MPNKGFTILAFVFFLFNIVGLPYGLTWMDVCAPLLYGYLVVVLRREPLFPFLILIGMYALIHQMNGVNNEAYLISAIHLITVYLFGCAFYVYLKRKGSVEPVFYQLLLVNFILCIIALFFYTSPLANWFWIEQFLTRGFDDFRRLKMFTYEASHYATLFVPLFFYFLLKMLFGQTRNSYLVLIAMISLPLLLSFSLGVISCIILAFLITLFLYFSRLIRKRIIFHSVISALLLVLIATVFLSLFFPDNPLFVRIANIFTGHDSSGKGRTSEAFMLASQIIEQKSRWFGIGPGQLKDTGAEIIRNYYQYGPDYAITIPNASAETLLTFGWTGLILRFAIEFLFFFKTKVWNNYFRLLLFLFIFFYQLTGSFLTNMAEYVIWIMAFAGYFPAFSVPAARRPIPEKIIPDDSSSYALSGTS